MIDYTKFVLIGIDPHTLLNNPLLNFKDIYEEKTGVLGKYRKATYKGLVFKIYYGDGSNEWYSRIILAGSLHKFWNEGKHNFNDFGITELKTVLKILKNDFNINPKNCHINQIEVGVNLVVPFNVRKFLSCCIMHKTNSLKWCKTNGEGYYLLSEFQRYAFKLYDKGTQAKKLKYNIDHEILRIEIKYSNMEDLRKKFKILTLEDFLEFGLQKFIPLLIKKWQEVIFYEMEIFNNTKDEYRYSSNYFWENLKTENFKYHRKEMYKKIKKFEKNTTNFISQMIQEKSLKLLNIPPKLNVNV